MGAFGVLLFVEVLHIVMRCVLGALKIRHSAMGRRELIEWCKPSG